MTDRSKTGNRFLDAWIDALNPLAGGISGDTSGDAMASAAWPFSLERMFFANQAGAPVQHVAGWASGTAQVTELWTDLAQRSLGVMTALGSTSNAGDPLREALEQSFGVMGDVGGAAAEGPALLAEAARAASALYAAREAYRAVMLATWQRALEEVTREAARRAGEGGSPATPSQWLSHANSVADRVFVEAFNSQAYLDAQRRLSSALADQRSTEMKLVEFFARFGHFPTRRALDDVSQEVAELRRRVRRLERASRSGAARRSKSEAADGR